MLSQSSRTLTVHFQSLWPRSRLRFRPQIRKPLAIMLLTVLSLVSSATRSAPQGADSIAERILPLRERAALQDDILADRLDTLIPTLMRREGIGAWVLIAREYNEDPIVKTMLPATWLNARRRTVLLFIDRGEALGVERMAVARYAVGDLFPGVWNPEEQPDQYARIAEILSAANPKNIVAAAPVLTAKNSATYSKGPMKAVNPFIISEKATCSLEKEFNAPSAPSSNAEKLLASCLLTSSNTAALL